MLVLGHVGTALTAAGYADREADLRWVILLTLVADIVDKPIGLILLRDTVNSGRVYFHSLLVNLLLTLVLVALRKPLVYALALWVHQLCDRMWMTPTAALWPFAGGFPYRPLPLEDWAFNLLTPYNAVSETLGLALLVSFAWRKQLLSFHRVRMWLRSGKLPQLALEGKARVW